MSEGKIRKKVNQAAAAERNARPVFTWILYLVVVLIAAGLIAVFKYQQRLQQADLRARLEAAEQRSEKLALQNQAVGLPDTYPADFMPLYPGVELLSASSEEAKADDGALMDKWHVLSQIDEDKEVVYEFYKARIEAEDLRQTMYISLPTGYSISYADENRIVELRIEKLRQDPKLQVEITLYIVKGREASKAPYDPAVAPSSRSSAPVHNGEPIEAEATAADDQAREGAAEDKPTSDPPA